MRLGFAGILAIILLQTPPAIHARPQSKNGTIQGTVVSATTGQPVRKACVILNDTRDDTPAFRTSSRPDGTFVFRDVPPGRYSIRADHRFYATQQYYSGDDGRRRRIIQVGPSGSHNVTLRLAEGGVITGRIRDSDGDPVFGAKVESRRTDSSDSRTAETNELGEFRISGLRPGRYLVLATPLSSRSSAEQLVGVQYLLPNDPNEKEENVPTYYPGVTSAGSALQLQVHAGQEVRADMVLSRGSVAAVRGRLVVPVDRTNEYSVALLDSNYTEVVSLDELDEQGNFVFARVPAGHYFVLAHSPLWRSNQPVKSATQAIRVDGSDVGGILLTPIGGASVRGRVVVPAGQGVDLKQLRIRFDIATCFHYFCTEDAEPQADGSFEVSLMMPGKYDITARVEDSGAAYLVSGTMGGQDVLEKGIDVQAEHSYPSITLVVAPASGSVHGVVTDAAGVNVDGATVFLLADDDVTRRRFTGQTTRRSDESGRFDFSHVPPGKYRIVAIQIDDESLTDDSAFREKLRKLGAELTLADGQRASVALKPVVVGRQ